MHTGPDSQKFVFLKADGPQHFAVEQLIEYFGKSKKLSDFAATSYLDRFDRNPTGLFADRDALEYAYRIGMLFPLSNAVADRLIRAMARAGWHGRLEATARKLRERDPTPEEVVFLIDTYVNDTAVKSGSSLETYGRYARAYLPPEEAAKQIARIEKHDRDFNRD